MLRIKRSAWWIVPCLLFVLNPVEIRAQEAGEIVIVQLPVEDDLYAAGGEIEILAPVSGDAVLAGGTIRLSDRVGGDLISAGGNIRLFGSVADDVRLAGGRVAVQGPVSGHAVAAGGYVQIAREAEIGDFAWLAGGRVEIAGTVGSDLKAVGREIILSGRVDGNAELAGQSIRIGDNAIINGDLTWSSPVDPDISESAEIAGQVIADGFEIRGWEPQPRRAWLGGVLAVITITVSAGLLFSMFPTWSDRLTGSVRDRPVVSPVVGLATIATTPVAMVLLFMTGIGALLGVLVMLSYGLMLALGGLFGVIAAASLSRSLLRRDRPNASLMTWLCIALVAVIIVFLNTIQPLGFILVTLILFYGAGALVLNTYQTIQAARK